MSLKITTFISHVTAPLVANELIYLPLVTWYFTRDLRHHRFKYRSIRPPLIHHSLQLNTLRFKQNGRHVVGRHFQMHFGGKEGVWFMSKNFVLESPINKLSLIQSNGLELNMRHGFAWIYSNQELWHHTLPLGQNKLIFNLVQRNITMWS